MAKKLTNKQKKDWAYSEFMIGELNQVEIAEKVGTSKVSMNRWVMDGKWKELKEALTTTREAQLKKFTNQLDALNKEIESRDQKYPNNKEVDIQIKLTKAIETFKGKASTSDRISFTSALVRFLRINFPDKVKETTLILDLFIKENL
ncbi:MAG: DDE transposase family protein [Prevotella sp.]|jgi:uncharacterized protein YjcR|nr:DDE transposase family protein [Prevotella sp.]